LSSFTHPQVVPNLYEFVSSAEHKDILKNDWNFGTTDLHSIFFFLLWKSMVPNNCLVSIVPQTIFLCVQQKKQTHTGMQQLEKMMTEFFWMECPFK